MRQFWICSTYLIKSVEISTGFLYLGFGELLDMLLYSC
ncbi:hypothetical protein Gotur_029591 [Gossypium turneri]